MEKLLDRIFNWMESFDVFEVLAFMSGVLILILVLLAFLV